MAPPLTRKRALSAWMMGVLRAGVPSIRKQSTVTLALPAWMIRLSCACASSIKRKPWGMSVKVKRSSQALVLPETLSSVEVPPPPPPLPGPLPHKDIHKASWISANKRVPNHIYQTTLTREACRMCEQ